MLCIKLQGFLLDNIIFETTFLFQHKTRRWFIIIGLISLFFFDSQLLYGQMPSQNQFPEQAKNWIFKGNTKNIQGIGITDYSRYNPDKSWEEAFKLAIDDLNANHSLLVYHYGYQIGRGPLRMRSNYAIRTILDSTQVAVVDSARWNGRAFLLIEPQSPVSDSIIYPDKEFETVNDTLLQPVSNSTSTTQWIRTVGSAPRINSNWNMSVTKAKQNALRNLAEDLAVKTSTEIYSKNNVQRRYYNFSTIYAFQRIKTLERSFNTDSVRVQLAVDPKEIKMLLEE